MSADPRVLQPAQATPRRRRGRVPAFVLGVLLFPVVLYAGAAAVVWATAATDTSGRVAFTSPLAVPPLAEARIDGVGRRVFDLRLQSGRTDFGLGG